MNGAAKGEAKVFERGDNSAWERLHGIYTEGTKHSDDIASPVRPHAPTTIWLTNDGVECLTSKAITFQELSEIIAAKNELFYDIHSKAYEKLGRRGPASSGSKRLV